MKEGIAWQGKAIDTAVFTSHNYFDKLLRKKKVNFMKEVFPIVEKKIELVIKQRDNQRRYENSGGFE